MDLSTSSDVSNHASSGEEEVHIVRCSRTTEIRRDCPCLHTINRQVLDYEVDDKCCCVCWSRWNVFACLVCGKYFHGRGLSTHAFHHSVEAEHHVYFNLHSEKFYCLPDNYQILDSSLHDIVLNFRLASRTTSQ